MQTFPPTPCILGKCARSAVAGGGQPCPVPHRPSVQVPPPHATCMPRTRRACPPRTATCMPPAHATYMHRSVTMPPNAKHNFPRRKPLSRVPRRRANPNANRACTTLCRPRQVAMIGLGSTIGTGLFLGSAVSRASRRSRGRNQFRNWRAHRAHRHVGLGGNVRRASRAGLLRSLQRKCICIPGPASPSVTPTGSP